MSQVTHDVLFPTANSAALSESDRHRLLQADRRRHALEALADRTGPVDLADLAAAVAAREAGLDADDPEDVSAVTTTLHHIHLPKMADAGVVDYDHETNCVTT